MDVFRGRMNLAVLALVIRNVSGAGRCEPQRSTEVGAVGSSDLPRPLDSEGNDGSGPDPPDSSTFRSRFHFLLVSVWSDPEEPTLGGFHWWICGV